MKINLVITSENDTVLEKITVEPHLDPRRPEDHHNLTDTRFAQQIIEYLSRQFKCMVEL